MATKRGRKPYQFNPIEHGFRNIADYPELLKIDIWAKNTYIKITCLGGKEFGDRLVYWYVACHKIGFPTGDDRWEFNSSSFDSDTTPEDYQKRITYNMAGRTVYQGCITSNTYFRQLICHLMAATTNDSVYTHGAERFGRDEYPASRLIIEQILKLKHD